MDIGIKQYSDQLVTDIKPLLELHYQELTMHKDYVKLEIGRAHV